MNLWLFGTPAKVNKPQQVYCGKNELIDIPNNLQLNKDICGSTN